MCGLIGFIAKQNNTRTGELVSQQHQDQFDRGKEGFGLIEITKKNVSIKKSTEPIKATIELLNSDAPAIIFHHRKSTSTTNTIKQAHPIKITHKELKYDYFITHNGTLRNEDDLFTEHTKKLGYKYSTLEKSYNKYGYSTEKFNDSEAFAIELVRNIEKLEKEIKIEGSAAWIGIAVSKTTGKAKKMFWGRNDGRTLDIIETKEGLLIASDILNNDAYTVGQYSMEEINIEKYLNRKTPPKNIIDTKLLTTTFINFYEEPKEIPSLPPPSKNDTPTHPALSNKTSTNLPEDDRKVENAYTFEDEQNPFPMSEIEKVFDKKVPRVQRDMEADISMFFNLLANNDFDKDNLEYEMELTIDQIRIILQKSIENVDQIKEGFQLRGETSRKKLEKDIQKDENATRYKTDEELEEEEQEEEEYEESLLDALPVKAIY